MIDHVLDNAHRSTAGRRPIVVLLVDDQQFVGTVVGQLLATESDIELHCCLEAVHAVAVANQVGPGIILQDLVMPEIDGLTLVGLYRANAMTAGTPIVVLSGNDDRETRGRALAAGATAYLVKLPPKADLVACIRLHTSGEGTQSGASTPSAETPPPDAEETLDRSVLAHFRELDPGFTQRLIDQFLQEAEARVHTLRGAAERHDPSALSTVAHALKGSAMTMGVRRLAMLCMRIEEQVAADPSAGVTALMTAIDQELVRVRHALASDRPGGEA